MGTLQVLQSKGYSIEHNMCHLKCFFFRPLGVSKKNAKCDGVWKLVYNDMYNNNNNNDHK